MTAENGNGENNNYQNPDDIRDLWMIRPCEDYDDEYSECKSFKARFHQYFIYGDYTNCNQWKRDSDNCYKWVNNKDVKAAKEIIESEKDRRLDRLRGHFDNTVWTKRKSPPEDWNKPLPEYMQKEYENTFLNIKAKEMKGEYTADSSTSFLDRSSFCSIM